MSFRAAINGKCKDCIYDPMQAGTWLQQVFLCTSDNCALFDFRPIPQSRRTSTLTEAEKAKKRAILSMNLRRKEAKKPNDALALEGAQPEWRQNQNG